MRRITEVEAKDYLEAVCDNVFHKRSLSFEETRTLRVNLLHRLMHREINTDLYEKMLELI